MILVSLGPNGEFGDGYGSWVEGITDDGDVLFRSDSGNFIPVPTGAQAHRQMYVADRDSRSLELVSAAGDGSIGNGSTLDGDISANGRWVAFGSQANNLVPGDSGDTSDVFLRDRRTDETTRISTRAGRDGGNRGSWQASISDDGSVIAFASEATNLVRGDTNGARDVFVWTRGSGRITRVSVHPAGKQGRRDSWDPSISGDGRFVAFSSSSRLLRADRDDDPDVYVHDLRTGRLELVSVGTREQPRRGFAWDADLSKDGRYVTFTTSMAFAGKDHTHRAADWDHDVYMRDRRAGTTRLISVNSDGKLGDDRSEGADVSADGRYVTFISFASNLTRGDTNRWMDVFVRDVKRGETELVSVAADGYPAASGSEGPAYVSATGKYVAFSSDSAELHRPVKNIDVDALLWIRRR